MEGGESRIETLIQDVSRILEQAENGKEACKERFSKEVEKQEQEYMDIISNHFEALYESCRSVWFLTDVSLIA